jgi:hypothetical protein
LDAGGRAMKYYPNQAKEIIYHRGHEEHEGNNYINSMY